MEFQKGNKVWIVGYSGMPLQAVITGVPHGPDDLYEVWTGQTTIPRYEPANRIFENKPLCWLFIRECYKNLIDSLVRKEETLRVEAVNNLNGNLRGTDEADKKVGAAAWNLRMLLLAPVNSVFIKDR